MARTRDASSPVTWNSVTATRAVVGYCASGWPGIEGKPGPGTNLFAGGVDPGTAGGAAAFGARGGAGVRAAGGAAGSGVLAAGAAGSAPFGAAPEVAPVRVAAGFLPFGVDGLSAEGLDCASAPWAPSKTSRRESGGEMRTGRP
jgi:hypothetical protein